MRTLTLTPKQSRALSRLLKHVRAAWLEADDAEKSEEPFSPPELEILLPLLNELEKKPSRNSKEPLNGLK